MLRFFPFMALAALAYVLTVTIGGGNLTSTWLGFNLPSGQPLSLTLADGLLLLATGLLFAEIMNATSAKASSLFNHGLSMLVFIACGLAFLLLPSCGTGTFLIITMMALLDVVAGYSISILTARRDFALEREA
ncbi:MAG: hypothetical protein ACRDBH_03005 [Bosea sp. (in: a-proteobacteria)]